MSARVMIRLRWLVFVCGLVLVVAVPLPAQGQPEHLSPEQSAQVDAVPHAVSRSNEAIAVRKPTPKGET